jgi:hypothetical protein
VTRAKPAREPFVLWTCDHQVGSTQGLAPKSAIQNSNQEWLLTVWQDIIKRTQAEAKDKQFVLAFGGDGPDGARHHGNWETWGTDKEQCDATIELLQPLADIAVDVRAIMGTEVHAGPKGDGDRRIAEALGAATAKDLWEFTIAERRVFWTHHGVSVPRDPWNESNGLLAMAKRLYEISLREAEPAPHYAIFHHAHFSPPPVTAHGITVAICPSMQLSTRHGYKIGPEKRPAIGALAFWPKQNRLERWLYKKPHAYEDITPK